MIAISNEQNSFEDNIKKAINSIKSNKYDLARKYLYLAMVENDHSSEVYNLLGVISEYKRDMSLACRYYRAAYVFDETYKPADKNLERVTSFFYTFNESSIDFGDGHNMKEEPKKSYFIEYNAMNIGHLKKNKPSIKSAG